MIEAGAAPDTLLPAESEIDAIVRGQHGNPFAVLGMHPDGEAQVVRVFAPDAAEVAVIDARGGEVRLSLRRAHPEGFFAGRIRGRRFAYRLRLKAGDATWERDDPYAFEPVLGDMDEYLIAEGRHEELWRRLGAHPMTHGDADGVAFAVWAPNARRVSVVGDFNSWDGRRHVMRKRHGAGLWELFVPGLSKGDLYKFEIVGAYGELLPLKSDPLSFRQQPAPETSSIVHGLPRHAWSDEAWVKRRAETDLKRAPVSIYEVHLGSWRRDGDGGILDYATAAELLAEYATDMGFTHVELLPVSEHPFTGSWGYQPIGLFAPTSRYGDPDGFAAFVDRLHAAGLGVIVDWVPAHFPSDTHGLARFDGTALYEHEDPRLGFHRDWNTLIYNFGRTEVSNFLRASGMFWLQEYHVDALRVDAVASMLYLDYSREPGEWIPNRYGGRENLDAIAFLRATNEQAARVPGPPPWPRSPPPGPASQARRRGGPRLRLQVEHGVDARHPGVHARGPAPPALPPQQDDLRNGLRLLGELRPAAEPRRGGARQGLDDRQDARRPLAALREPARLLRLHVDAPGQEAPLHGRRVRPGARVEPRHLARLASPGQRGARGRAARRARPQPGLPRRGRAPRPRLRGRRASSGSTEATPISRSSSMSGAAWKATGRSSSCAT